jgi:molybdopterin/thiamine biosynthesis adenylyltransferase
MRYARQEVLIGPSAQKKLENSKVCIVGVGALGTLAAQLLVRSGVGSLILIDDDKIELDNLQRQHLFREKDVGEFKAKIAKKVLNEINSEINIKIITDRLNDKNLKIINSDIVLDCVDNLETSYLINDYCKERKIPLVFASVIRCEGYIYNLVGNVKSIKEIFHGVKTFENCLTQGVMNTATSLISSLQVNEAIKILTGKSHEEKLLRFDLTNNELLKIKC